MWGVFAGLALGKPLGVLLATRVALGSGAADRPEGTTGRHLLGAGTAAGIGFTVAIFIAELAFVRNGVPDEGQIADAKIAILMASLISGVVAFALVRQRGARVAAPADGAATAATAASTAATIAAEPTSTE